MIELQIESLDLEANGVARADGPNHTHAAT